MNKEAQVITEIMTRLDISQADMARILHIKPQSFHDRLNSKHMEVDTLKQVLKILGYKVVVLPDDVYVKEEIKL